MTGKILTIAQQKGGAGKTTLAAHLGVAWRRRGLKVAMLDIDPQASLSRWFEMREAEDEGLSLAKVGGWRVPAEVERLKRDADLVIVDCPPHGDTEAKIAVRAADLVLVPVQPSSMDIWATGQILTLAVAEKAPALVVLNRVPARARLVEQARAMLQSEDMPVAGSAIGNRVAFAASMMEGRTALEAEPQGAAAADVETLIGEIARQLGI